MAIIFGIDAAWTRLGSSGVALLDTERRPNRLIAAAASYAAFVACDDAHRFSVTRDEGDALDVTAMLAAAHRLAGAPVDVVAIDMPMSKREIVGRRDADNAVSRAFGAARAGVHSPSKDRPGRLGAEMTDGFVSAGFTLATQPISDTPARWLLEVFPLAALVNVLRVGERPKYKVGKIAKLWRHLDKDDRLPAMLDVWRTIVQALQAEIGAFAFAIPEPTVGAAALKPYEDVLDAIVCAWVGMCVLEGRATPYPSNDPDAAIWIPDPR